MKRLLPMILGLLAAACRPAAVPDAPAPPPPTSIPAVPTPEAVDLFGEWQMASLETPLLGPGQRGIGDPTRVVVLIGVDSIQVASQCVPYFFEYGRGGSDIAVKPVRWPGPVCARGLLPYEEILDDVFAGASRIELAQGGVRLAGRSGAVTLRRPEGGYLANPFGNEPPPGPRLFWGHFRLVDVAGVRPADDQPIDLAIGGFGIEARSGCVTFGWHLELGPQSLSVTREPSAAPSCERMRTEAEEALESVMPAVRRFAWVAPYRVRLSGSEGSLVLERVR